MTTEKMPDVVNIDWYALQEAYQNTGPFTRYIRAEPVEELLKQARDALEVCKWWIGGQPPHHKEEEQRNLVVIAIDKFLGDK